jgi:hypothetical protein
VGLLGSRRAEPRSRPSAQRWGSAPPPRPRRRSWALLLLWLFAVDSLLLAILLTFSRGALLGLGAAALAMSVGALRLRQTGSLRLNIRSVIVGITNLGLVAALFLIPSSSVEAIRLSDESSAVWFRMQCTAVLPSTMLSAQQQKVSVTVKNLSPLDWTPTHPNDYQLSYHWLYPSRLVAQFITVYTPITQVIPAGAQRQVIVLVRAPAVPGRYLLVWDVLWHGSTWFALKTGLVAPTAVRVVPLTRSAIVSHSGTAASATHSSGTYLPVEQQPDRQQMWSSALDTFVRHPVFGAGPNGFREGYGQSVQPSSGVAPVGPPTHAHNLLLELLANWGIAGTGLLAALVVTIWWPLLTRLWHRRPNSGWDLALLGAGAAFLAHGTVDYFLGVTSVLVAIWLLGALASTQPTEV